MRRPQLGLEENAMKKIIKRRLSAQRSYERKKSNRERENFLKVFAIRCPLGQLA